MSPAYSLTGAEPARTESHTSKSRSGGQAGPIKSGAVRSYTYLGAEHSSASHGHRDPAVQEALDELRAKLNGERIDMAELVILGAHAKARRLQADNATPGRLAGAWRT